MIGIYKIENLINGHKYIGQSTDIEDRWTKEKQRAFQPKAHDYNYPLSRAFRKYGVNNFSFEIIEECTEEELNERERYWVQYYDTFFNGYNQTLGGDGSINKPKEYIIGIITDLENTDMYHKEIAKKWNVSVELVQGINTGRYWKQIDKEYPLQKTHKIKSQHIVNQQREIIEYFCEKCNKSISRGAKLCQTCAAEASRKVKRPNAKDLYEYLKSINGNFSKAAKEYGVSDNAIRKWCKSYNIPSSSAAYKTKNLKGD